MKFSGKHQKWGKTAMTAVLALAIGASASFLAFAASESDPAVIKSVYGIGFVDADGSKLEAIAVQYSEDIDAASVQLADYEVEDYCTLSSAALQAGENAGVPLKAYVSKKAVTGQPADSGSYVIIEVNTDYMLASVASNYKTSMAAGVKQVGEVKTASGKTVVPTDDFVTNYVYSEVPGISMRGTPKVDIYWDAIDGQYTIKGIEDYQLFTIENNTAFHAVNCFDEATGQYSDVDLPYALYVPGDYNPDGKYMLILHVGDAGTMGTDPMLSLTQSEGPSNFASDKVQNIVKNQGYDGLIVLIPQIDSSIRTTRDNYTISCGVPATWQLLDKITSEYSIDKDRIYATGQSMGGMQVIAMASMRDNYFAGILEMGCQWGSNYNKEEEYEGNSYYDIGKATEYDQGITCVDYENWYYVISDDNILCVNCVGDSFSTSAWTELKYLYSDIAGVEIPYAKVSPLEDSINSQNAKIRSLVKKNNDCGIYWLAFEGGSHMSTWFYGQRLDALYEWLFSQTRQTEVARSKIEQLANKWEKVTDESVIKEKGHVLTVDNGVTYYYAVPAEGAGTDGYNSGWLEMNGGAPIREPGWTVN